MTNVNTNHNILAQDSSYKIFVSGGGEFAFIPMSPEQMSYWYESGTEALKKHLAGEYGGDRTPPHLSLRVNYFYDQTDWDLGVCADAQASVQTKDGRICFQKSRRDPDSIIEFKRVFEGPENATFFRIFEKGLSDYETTIPFDPSDLRLRVKKIPKVVPSHDS